MRDGDSNRWCRGRRQRAFGAVIRIAFVAVVSVICSAILNPASAEDYRFTNVRIEGVERVDPATILSYAGIARGKTVTSGELNDAAQRVSNSGLFASVDMVPQGSTLIIRVKENPVINVIDFQGNKTLKDEQLAKVIKSQSRRVYSSTQAEADAATITDAYRQAGRYAATVTPKIIARSDNRVDLVFEISEGRITEIERLSFVGNRAFSDRRLRQVLETKQAGLLRAVIQSDTYVAERIELDKQLLRDFYLSRGYIDFQVLDVTSELQRDRSGFFLTFTVREGQSFKIGKISVISEVPDVSADDYRAVLRLKEGTTYTPTVVQANIDRMENLALEKGLNFVRVDPRVTPHEADGTLDIEFALVRGPKIFVERIDIEGNTTTLDQVIRRQFTTVEGDPFNPRAIRQAAERIKALGFFSQSDVTTKQGSAPDQVIVDVNVTEQPTGTLQFGVTYGVQTGIGFQISFSEANFLGRGQSLSAALSTGVSNSDSSIVFSEPAFLGRNVKFSFGAYYTTSNYDNSNYDTRIASLAPSIEFPIGGKSRLALRYKIGLDKIDNVDSGSSIILQNEAALGAQTYSSLGYTYSHDTRGTGLNPNAGVLFRFNQDFAGLGGDYKYIQSTALVAAETKVLREEVTLRAEFEAGYLHMLGGQSSRVTQRYFLNGQIRGFERYGIGPRDLTAANQDALGGNAYAVARFEAEFPLGLPDEYGITGGLFWDVGTVWSLNNTTGTSGTVDDSLHWRSALGFSIFWKTPIGPLRFNFSQAIKKESYDKTQNFDLTISTRF